MNCEQLLIHIRNRINAFDAECEAAQYTDPSEVWDLLNDFRTSIDNHLEEE